MRQSKSSVILLEMPSPHTLLPGNMTDQKENLRRAPIYYT